MFSEKAPIDNHNSQENADHAVPPELKQLFALIPDKEEGPDESEHEEGRETNTALLSLAAAGAAVTAAANSKMDRRSFLKFAGAAGATALTVGTGSDEAAAESIESPFDKMNVHEYASYFDKLVIEAKRTFSELVGTDIPKPKHISEDDIDGVTYVDKFGRTVPNYRSLRKMRKLSRAFARQFKLAWFHNKIDRSELPQYRVILEKLVVFGDTHYAPPEK